MFTTVGKARMDIATGWAASLGLSIPTWQKGKEILVERIGPDQYRPIGADDVARGLGEVIIPGHLLDFDLDQK